MKTLLVVFLAVSARDFDNHLGFSDHFANGISTMRQLSTQQGTTELILNIKFYLNMLELDDF